MVNYFSLVSQGFCEITATERNTIKCFVDPLQILNEGKLGSSKDHYGDYAIVRS